jgi:hypothetical protein
MHNPFIFPTAVNAAIDNSPAAWPTEGRMYAGLSTEILCALVLWRVGPDHEYRIDRAIELSAGLAEAVTNDRMVVVVTLADDGELRMRVTADESEVAELLQAERVGAWRMREVREYVQSREPGYARH